MLVEIVNISDELYFKTDWVNVLINTFDELCLTNKSLSFHYSGVDVSISVVANGLSCLCSNNSFSPRVSCDMVSLIIRPGYVDILGERDKKVIMHTHLDSIV